MPLDGSPFAKRAVPLATALARRTGSSLSFVRVHVDALDVNWSAAPFGRIDAMRRELEFAHLKERATPGDSGV
jgi:nucleotide-binding universal stress UspA family protein